MAVDIISMNLLVNSSLLVSISENTFRMQSIGDANCSTLPRFYSAFVVSGEQYMPVLLS